MQDCSSRDYPGGMHSWSVKYLMLAPGRPPHWEEYLQAYLKSLASS